MLTDSELAQARALQETAMTDTCTIRRPGGTAGEFDPETGARETVPHDPHYTGVCRVQAVGNASAIEQVVAGQEITSHVYAVAVPWSVTSVKVDDLLTVTETGDPLLLDKVLHVVDVQASSYATARRVLATLNLG